MRRSRKLEPITAAPVHTYCLLSALFDKYIKVKRHENTDFVDPKVVLN